MATKEKWRTGELKLSVPPLARSRGEQSLVSATGGASCASLLLRERKGRRFLSGVAAPRWPPASEPDTEERRKKLLSAPAFESFAPRHSERTSVDPWDGPAEGCQACCRRIPNESKKCWRLAKLSTVSGHRISKQLTRAVPK